jgi:phage terminase large subunit-like protein
VSGVGRRESVALLGGAAAVAWPVAARAQQGERVRHIGVIMALEENSPTTMAIVQQLRDGLQALGWTEGNNLHCTYRFG